MKRIIYSLLLLLLFVAPSCVRRTTISDEELALIFRDAFLSNAYVYDANVKFDTVQVYQPIFEKYGYTAEDVAYTVGSFSKRKSARLSDIVERAIRLLEEGSQYYKAEAVILDTIDNIAVRAATKRIYYDSLLSYYSLSDTTKLTIVFDSLAAGNYTFKFNYHVDSLDTNRSSYRTLTWVQPEGSTYKKGLSTSYLRKKTDAKFERKISFDTLTHNLMFMLAETFEVKRKPHITFTDISVDFIPHTDAATDELLRKRLDIRIFANEFFDSIPPTDSLELSAL